MKTTGGSTKGKGARPALAKAKKSLTARQRAVIRTGAANVADKYNLKGKGEARFRRSALKQIAKAGPAAGAYKNVIKKGAKYATTAAEAKGAAKVLKRATGAENRSRPKTSKKRTLSSDPRQR